jgi:hypothetical protein
LSPLNLKTSPGVHDAPGANDLQGVNVSPTAGVPWNRLLTLTFPRDTGWSKAMSFEDKEAELGLLLTRMQNEPEDRHELYLQIRLKLNELKAYGMPLPETLVRLERQLEAEFEADQGA